MCKTDDSLKEEWKQLSDEGRADWHRSVHESVNSLGKVTAALVGKSLRALVTESEENSDAQKHNKAALCAGRWLTEEDLDVEFKEKPKKKAAILEHNDTWDDPVTHLKYYKVEEFTTKVSEETERALTKKRKSEVEGELLPKKVKRDKPPRPEQGRL